jgi:hypothetical protein
MSANVELNPATMGVRLPRPVGFRNVSTSVGASGEAIRLWVNDAAGDSIFATEKQPSGASFPKTHTEQTYAATVLVTTEWGSVEHQLPFMAATFPMVQTLPGDEFLVVASRCQRFKDGTHEMNARVYHADGSIKREFCLGDGIEHVQVDSEGHIWVGYFDEGIFGNCGWGSRGGATIPVAAITTVAQAVMPSKMSLLSIGLFR